MMNLSALKIDPEFQGKIPPLNAEEEHILEQNMIQERRLLNPLIIWNGYILDGHSRYRILKHHPEIAFEVKEIQLPDRYAALAWICQNQLGRRNLDPERRKFLMGKAYESQKLSDWGENPQNRNKQSGRFAPCGQNDHMDTHLRTCEKIAQANGVSPKFVRRAEKYANGIDAAEAAVPGVMEEILTGHIKATDAEITALAQTPKEEIPAIIKELRKPKKDRKAKKPTSPEKSDGAADDAADSNEVHTESEITPVSNSPPDFKRSIQGHKRCLTDEDRKRLRQSIDNRHHKTTVANGSIMMCEVQYRRDREGGRRLPQELSGGLPQRERLYGQDHRGRKGKRLCIHPVRPPPHPAGAGQHQLQRARQRRAHGPQHDKIDGFSDHYSLKRLPLQLLSWRKCKKIYFT